MKEILIRRWRTATLIILGIAALAVYFAMANERVRQTARTIDAIARLNGRVESQHSIVFNIPGMPKKLGTPDHVSFFGPKLDDRELKVLDGLPRLRTLTMVNTRVTDDGIAWLARFPKLDCLAVANTDQTRIIGPRGASLNTPPEWTGKGVRNLKLLPNLLVLQLGGPHVTDADLPALMSLKRLLAIDLFQTSVTKEGVATLRKSLPNCQVTYR